MRTMRTAAVALALAAVVAGCGRGDGTDEVAVVRDLDLMQGVEAEGSSRIAMEMELDVPLYGVDGMEAGDPGDEPQAISVLSGRYEGVMAYAAGDAELTGEMSTTSRLPEGTVDELLPPLTLHHEVRIRAGEEWFRTWAEGDEPGSWFAPPSFGDEDEDEDFSTSPLPVDPAELLDRLRDEARSFTEVGSDEVRGDAATRYRAEVDGDAVGEALPILADGDVTLDVWVDDEDRLRRLETEGVTLELWDFGVPVEVEEPTDVSDELAPDLDSSLPRVEGDWAELSAGTTAGVGWSVFAAPGRVQGAETVCRTFEVEGAGLPGSDVLPVGDDSPLPMHGGALASCGSGFLSVSLGRFVPDPALQVLAPTVFDGPALTAFVVPPRFADGGIRLIREGADPVELELDAGGVAVWDGSGSPVVTAVELDGGAVTCGFTTLGGIDESGGLDPGPGLLGALGPGPDPCVRT